MKILFILKSFPKISETFILQELYLLQKSGYNFEIISLESANENIYHNLVDRINASVTYLPKWRSLGIKERFYLFVTGLWGYKTSYLRVFLESLHHSRVSKSLLPFKLFLAATWILRKVALNSNKYHVHSHYLSEPTDVAYYMYRISFVRYSITAHAKDIYLSSPINIRRKVSKCVKIKTCTRYNLKYLQEKCPNFKNKISAVLHGIDVDMFSSEASLYPLREPLKLITVGRLVEKKGYFDILNALNLLRIEKVEFVYTIIGDGILRKKIEERIIELNMQNNVSIVSQVRHSKIRSYLENSDIFIFGSIIGTDGNRDGIPNSLAEAMAMKKPVIATNISGIPEIVKHMETGYLSPPNSPVELCVGIRYYLENPMKAIEIGENAQKFINDNFNHIKCFAECKSFFENVLVNEKN